MLFREYIYRRRCGLAFFTLCLALSVYFAFHAVHGKHGLEARMILKKEAERLEQKLSTLKATRTKLEHDVSLLHPERIDPDMLDEQSRRVLKFAHPNDLVILKPSSH